MKEMLSYNWIALSVLSDFSGCGDTLEERDGYSEHNIQSIKLDQERLLTRIVQRIQAGIAIYEDASTINSDYIED